MHLAMQLRDLTPLFMWRCNPFARAAGVALDLDDGYAAYLERCEKSKDGQAFRWAAKQVRELAGLRRPDDELPLVFGPGRLGARAAYYCALRLDGSDHRWADMISSRQPPGAMTDREFLEGHCNGSQFEAQPEVGDYYRSVAAAAGVNTKGAVYINGLASYPGDPTAWVSGRGDVLRVCQEKGMSAQGAVNYTSAPRETAPDVDVADDIVEQRVLAKLETDPSLAGRLAAEVFHEAKEEIKPHWTAAA